MNAKSFEAIDEEELEAKAEQLEQFLPHSELISMSAAFELAKAIASDLGVTGYKTERLLTRELRKESLIATRQVTPIEDWLKSSPPQYEEVTSKRAIDELFKRKAARRRQLDRDRKRKLRAQSVPPNKKFKNNPPTLERRKRTHQVKKADI
jgi:hypothetical protein